MFKKILIANRGEIALRVIRAARELGVQTVAIYSEVDKDSLHVKLADESYCIGPAASAQSYLNIPTIISVAEISGAEAIHPGYGFLAENSKFVEICEEHRITFIGPDKNAIQKMGDKSTAKETVKKAGVPVVPGSEGNLKDAGEAKSLARHIGYPVLIKATAGGGGKGMRVVKEEKGLEELYKMAKTEAEAAFGNADVYLEKYIEEPRHIEVQILADKFGQTVHLGERDCSIQRRHQKLVEESLSPVVDQRLRDKLGEAAIKAARAVKYVNAGTVEFIFDPAGHFFFMEMNTRVQVEHPVTEMITSIDIIKEQILIAAGEKMSFRQKDIKFSGHAIECRINAENPSKNFMPSPGEVTIWHPPGGLGVRVDSHVYQGYHILPNYDSLIAKLICWGRDRKEAISRMRRALNEFIVDGISTTIPFHLQVMDNQDFQSGKFSTHFVEKHFSQKK